MMDNVEDYALVNETVDAVRSVGMKGLTGFVNGVLRTALRQKDSILARLERQPPATRYSHPELLIRRWTAQHGEEKAIELCKWNNSRPSITMRIRHSKTNMDEMLTQLSAMDWPALAKMPSATCRSIAVPGAGAINSVHSRWSSASPSAAMAARI